MQEGRALPEAGALLSYGPNYAALLREAERHVDEILKGARPADLPVEERTEYESVINLKTAKALGLHVSTISSGDGQRGDPMSADIGYAG